MKEYWKDFKKIWRNCWAFYMLPITSVIDGYLNKPQNMSFAQHLVYPFKTYFKALKIWTQNELANLNE